MKIREQKPEEIIRLQAEEIRRLEHQIGLLQKALYGQSSERRIDDDSVQTSLFAELPAVLTDQGTSTDSIPAETTTDSKGNRARKPIPSKLKRVETLLDLTEEEKLCPICQQPMEKFGDDITEKLEYMRAILWVSQFIRPKYACKNHPEAGVAQAELPAQLIDRGIPAASLVAWIIYAKYFLHLPLHRLEKLFSHYGCDVKRQRMCDWEQQVASLLEPVIEAMRRQVDSGGYVQIDETTLKVMKDQSDGKLATGYFWPRSDGKQVIFEFDPSRAGKNAVRFLKDFSGIFQTDGLSAYEQVLNRTDVVRAACWAHARRKFVETEKLAPEFCAEILRRIRDLYAIERAAKSAMDQVCSEGVTELEYDQNRFAKRMQLRTEQKVKERIENLYTFLENSRDQFPLPKDPVRNAIEYLLNLRDELLVFASNGRVEIDNNLIENRIRPITLGRKNWLFAGSQSGAKKIAVMASLTGSAAMLGLDPYEYLHWLLEKLPTATDYESLTPLSYKRGLAQAA